MTVQTRSGSCRSCDLNGHYDFPQILVDPAGKSAFRDWELNHFQQTSSILEIWASASMAGGYDPPI